VRLVAGGVTEGAWKPAGRTVSRPSDIVPMNLEIVIRGARILIVSTGGWVERGVAVGGDGAL